MRICASCPTCRAQLPTAVEDGPPAIRCGRCGRDIALHLSDEVRADRAVDRCPVCEGGDFWARKDFDQKLGLAIIVMGALISGAFYWAGRDFIAYGILAGAVLIDLVVYGRLKDVTVCYRCHTEFRGSYRLTAPAFDLHTAEILEKEYARRTDRGNRVIG